MKRLLLTLTLMALFVTSCSFKAHAAASNPVTNSNGTAAGAAAATVEINPQPAAGSADVTPAPAPAAVSPTEKTKGKKSDPNASTGGKGGGKGPQVVPTSADPNFVAIAIAGRPTNNSITINVIPASSTTISVGYGTASGQYTGQTPQLSLPAGQPKEIEITNLNADTTYYYSVSTNGVNGIEQSFHTQRAAGSAFTFDIQGDSHPERVGKQFDPVLYAKTLAGAASDKPDFYMAIGDDFSVDQMKTVNAETVSALYSL